MPLPALIVPLYLLLASLDILQSTSNAKNVLITVKLVELLVWENVTPATLATLSYQELLTAHNASMVVVVALQLILVPAPLALQASILTLQLNYASVAPLVVLAALLPLFALHVKLVTLYLNPFAIRPFPTPVPPKQETPVQHAIAASLLQVQVVSQTLPHATEPAHVSTVPLDNTLVQENA